MSTIHNTYSKELFQQFGYFATWLPGLKLALGDVGYLKNNQFTKVTSLSELNIPFSKDETHNAITIDYASAGGVSIQLKSEGDLPIPNSTLLKADAGFIIRFSKENALLFKSDKTITSTIQNNWLLGKTIIGRFKANEWQRDWVVITELIQTGVTSIMVSNSANGKIELKSHIASNGINTPNLNGKLSIVHHRDIALRIIGEEGLTPLFKTMKIKGLNPFKPSFRETTPTRMEFKQVEPVELHFVECEFDEVE